MGKMCNEKSATAQYTKRGLLEGKGRGITVLEEGL